MLDKLFSPQRLVFMGGPNGPNAAPEGQAPAPQSNEAVPADVEKALKEYSAKRQTALDKADEYITSTDPKISLKVKEQAMEYKRRILDMTPDPQYMDPKRQNADKIKSMISDLQKIVSDVSAEQKAGDDVEAVRGERFVAKQEATKQAQRTEEATKLSSTPEGQTELFARSIAKRIEDSVAETGRIDLKDLQLQVQALSSHLNQNPTVLNEDGAWSTEVTIGSNPCRITYGATGISVEYSYEESGRQLSSALIFERDGKLKHEDTPLASALAANIPRRPRQPVAPPAQPKTPTRTDVAGETPATVAPAVPDTTKTEKVVEAAALPDLSQSNINIIKNPDLSDDKQPESIHSMDAEKIKRTVAANTQYLAALSDGLALNVPIPSGQGKITEWQLTFDKDKNVYQVMFVKERARKQTE